MDKIHAEQIIQLFPWNKNDYRCNMWNGTDKVPYQMFEEHKYFKVFLSMDDPYYEKLHQIPIVFIQVFWRVVDKFINNLDVCQVMNIDGVRTYHSLMVQEWDRLKERYP